MATDGITVRCSPTSKSQGDQHDIEDIENASGRHPLLKAKDSNIVESASSSNGGKGDSGSGTSTESSSMMKSLIASTMYSGCSVGMVLVNKSLASR